MDDDSDDFKLETGDWSKIKLPEQLKKVIDGGDLKDGETVVGTYSFEDCCLKVVFNDQLVGSSNRSGTVGFNMKFIKEKFEDDVEQTLVFGDAKKELTIIAKPSGDNIKDISKSGNVDQKINPGSINWVIDVNAELESLKGAEVTDTLPDGVTLDTESIEIYGLKVGIDGKLTEDGEPIDMEDKIQYDEDGKGLKVEFGDIEEAYRIKFKTNIVSQEDSYKNEAKLESENGTDGEADWEIDDFQWGTLIEKTGMGSDNNKNSKQITWQIDINKAQATLYNVKVEDEIPEGLDIQSIKIYELKSEGVEWEEGEEVTGDFDNPAKFPIELNDIGKQAYRIIVITDIDQTILLDDGNIKEEYLDGNNDIKYTFKNEAILKGKQDQDAEEAALDSSKADVEITWDRLVEKSGEEVTGYDDDVPVMEWTVTINKAGLNIKNAKFIDVIGEGHSLIEDSVKIKRGKSEGSFEDVEPEDLKSLSDLDNVDLDLTDKKGFYIELGDIEEQYTITYRTKIEDLDNNAKYENNAYLVGWLGEGDGPGVGGEGNYPILEEYEAEGKQSVNNKYEKAVANKEVGDTDYKGVDYDEKTMSWVITVDAIKEKITELTITDSFKPAKSMVFIKDSLKVMKGNETLKEKENGDDEWNYKVTNNGVDGFVLEFNGELERAKYEIYFKTSFDPDLIIEKGGTLNKNIKYENKALFEGTTEDAKYDEHDIETSDDADQSLKKWIHDGGKKDGELDRDERTITWKIYANALGQDRIGEGEEFKIVDTLSKGQVYKENSLKVYEFSLKKDGTIAKVTEEDQISSSDYNLTVNKDENGNETGFTLTFEDGIDIPVLVKFETNIEGISKEEYKNTAEVTGKDLNKTYIGKVDYDDHDIFVEKGSDLGDSTSAYTDDEIEWKITLNKSLSDIQEAVFTDIISEGHVYLDGSLKLYKGIDTEGNGI
ncbi:MAG: hypothetical protein GX329_07695 [Tissierellia bacterium]|nr:hypothetical protein [Tissierellia bacterium]